MRQASIYQAAFLTPPTTHATISKASELAHAHRMQLWDCVVCAASIDAGAKVLLTEDMQDGRTTACGCSIRVQRGNAEVVEAVWGN